MATAAKTKGGKMLHLTQIQGGSGRKPGMLETLIGLGLGKTHSRSKLEDTPSIRGMIFKVRHLIKVEEGK